VPRRTHHSSLYTKTLTRQPSPRATTLSPPPKQKNTHHTEKTWRVLEAAIHEINNHNASGLSFEELYR
jgi:hypothetical protein